MKTSPPKTKVVFRRERDGGIVALFPEEPATRDPSFCVCYAHQGQHGAADPQAVIRQSTPARARDFLPLAHELRGIGYRLAIRQRIAGGAFLARRRAILQSLNPRP